jgi:hypothetical protein
MARRRSNVHPDYYKTRGREPLGQDIIHETEKAAYSRTRSQEESERFKDEEDLISDRPQKRSKAESLDQNTGEPRSNTQLSSKTGKQSSAKKNASSRYGSSPMPAASPVAGAFGKEAGGSNQKKKSQAKRKRVN